MNEELFSDILQDTQLAYESSTLKNSGWYYSISSTRIVEDCILLIGLNWGVGSGNHEPQRNMPSATFEELYLRKGELRSFGRLYKRLNEYLCLEDFNKIVQSNFCFFRTPSDKELLAEHISLCLPLFTKFITLVSPKKIICFSKIARTHLLEQYSHSIEKREIQSNKKTLIVEKGYLKLSENLEIIFLPHPNAKFTNRALDEAWTFCFKNVNH